MKVSWVASSAAARSPSRRTHRAWMNGPYRRYSSVRRSSAMAIRDTLLTRQVAELRRFSAGHAARSVSAGLRFHHLPAGPEDGLGKERQADVVAVGDVHVAVVELLVAHRDA